MNDNMTLNEIENDAKKVTELNKILIQGAIDNFKITSEIAKKVTEENYKISNSIQNINESLEKIGKIADSVGMAYESKTHDLSETLNY